MPRGLQATQLGDRLGQLKVVFRADASLEIGSGHVMRCLTLAKALRERGAECRFICREHTGNLLTFIRSQGFVAAALPREAPLEEGRADERLAHGHWLGVDWATDAEQTKRHVADEVFDWLVVDHYGLDARWEASLRSHCREILAIDDLADRCHDCDLLLDQNLIAGMEDRYAGKLPVNCGRLLGPPFALLQQQYATLHQCVPPREGAIRRVLVYFGAADSQNVTVRTLRALGSLGLAGIAIDVVMNPDSHNAASIRDAVADMENATLHERVTSLAPLMIKADLAVGAGGATSWERCCLGLPSLVVTLADNQKPIASEMDRRGLIRWLGHYDEVDDESLALALKQTLDCGLEVDWSTRCLDAVDGRGTGRVISVLLARHGMEFRARPAKLNDEDLLNAATSRASHREAGRAERRQALHGMLRDPEGHQLVVVETSARFPIGAVKFEHSEGGWHVHYVASELAVSRNWEASILHAALRAFRASKEGSLVFCGLNVTPDAEIRSRSESSGPNRRPLSIAICSDIGSWLNAAIPGLLLNWLAQGHRVAWGHSAEDLPGGDLCFYLSYGRIVDAATRSRYANNLVVHASDLPKGRGWSPASWLILDGADLIPVTLLEAADAVDAGPIYRKEWIKLNGTELIDDWHALLADSTASLAQYFVARYPQIVESGKAQSGKPTTYSRRRAKDSALDPHKTFAEQFNQMRIADNEHYPVFFRYRDKEFVLKIFARK